MLLTVKNNSLIEKGEQMEELIVSVISLIVLVPIIYFLPLGLTNKGKGLITLVAFLMANLGILAQNTFTLWQTGLILLLLIILTVYIFDKRLNSFIFSKAVEKEPIADLLSESNEEFDDKIINVDNMNLEENNRLIKETPLLQAEEIIEVKSSLLKFEDDEAIEEPPSDGKREELVSIEKSIDEKLFTDIPVNVDEDEVKMDEETAFLLDRDVLQDEVTTEDEIHVKGYMSEIEQLLESDVLVEDIKEEQFLPKTDDATEFRDFELIDFETLFEEHALESDEGESMNLHKVDMLEEQISSDKNTLLEDDVIEVLHFDDDIMLTRETEDDSQKEMIPPLSFEDGAIIEDSLLDEDIELEVTKFEEPNDNTEDLQADVEDAQTGMLIDDLDLEFEDSLIEDEEDYLFEPAINEVAASIAAEDEYVWETDTDPAQKNEVLEEADEAKQQQKTSLQQQILRTIVSQLHLARNQMHPAEYEELIKEQLSRDLPAKDYYTFASLLIEHYISHKEIGKLQELLTNLEGKFENYPILDMEIHYLYEQYCENTR